MNISANLSANLGNAVFFLFVVCFYYYLLKVFGADAERSKGGMHEGHMEKHYLSLNVPSTWGFFLFP